FNAEETNNPKATATMITITAFGLDAAKNPEQKSATFNLGNGSNFSTTVASLGEVLTKVNLTFSPAESGITDLKQVRISGLEGAIIQSAPEPSSMAIAAFGALGMIGYGLWRHKTRGA